MLNTRFIFTALFLLISNLVLPTQRTPSREYQLKAVFLFNFTQFVEWPTTAFSTNESEMVIGIMGENPFDTYLEELVSGEKINGHPVVIRYFQSIEEITTCHILFIKIEDANKQAQIVSRLKKRNIVTVSETPEFPTYGGMIRFFTMDNKIKFQVNLEASKEANVILRSKLLRLAEVF